MSVTAQTVLIMVVGFCVWAAIDYIVVKRIDANKAKQPKPRGATAL